MDWEQMPVGAKYFGASVPRTEDPRLLRGHARYVDDITLPGLLHATIVRSPHAHARIRGIDRHAAQAHPGVARVFCFNDLSDWMQPMPISGAAPPSLDTRLGIRERPTPQYPLARDIVRYAGEPVAVIVARSRAEAEDAADLMEIDYDPLPAVIDTQAAVNPDSPCVYPDWGDNVTLSFSHRLGDPDAAMAAADVVVRETFRVQRYSGTPVECRGMVVEPHPVEQRLTIWNATQFPHFVQRALVSVLGWPAHRIRVVAPDVGGGFGVKASSYPEDILIPLAAMLLGRPVKWIEDRREHFMASIHSREQVHDIEIAAMRDGRIVAIRDRFLVDQGAYNPWGVVQSYNTVAHMLGLHRIANFSADVRMVITNKTPHAPYRGAGRPEAVFVMDRAVDRLARALNMDPAEIRRRNFITEAEMPYDTGQIYRDGQPLIYDTGNFPEALDKALQAIGYDTFRAEQDGLRAQGIYRGVGISSYVEGTGVGPYEGATVYVDHSGGVVVATGACSQGQGHETTFAQLAADAIGVTPDQVTVINADTAAIPMGVGTFASRSAVVAGSAVNEAAERVREKLAEAAGSLMEAAPDDIEIDDGQAFVRGVPQSAIPLARVVQSALPTYASPSPVDADFTATVYRQVPTVTYASAVHVALMEVDIETGVVKLLRYVVSHDCGRIINPTIVDGQIYGGVAQGIGGGLFEEYVYDENGQLLSGSMLDYLVPTATDVPSIDLIHLEYPSTRNPLGIKGVGEGGAVSPPAAIANAVEDALKLFDVCVREAPLTPERVRNLIKQGQGG
ncbi:xanthine dehydrogenase family protein molybdopterin-binding subunit [Candidatus Entotheonella palauensis]|nr:xanthine dehydrogenase family protein molybdopterin-binding subunit [Candidatus Entotheonella palauensis]